jgi:pimeloyl-ACP methyl ester carboxylesterase
MASLMLAVLAAGAAEADDPARFCGSYRWESGSVVDVQVWNELGPGRLVAFDDSGSIRALTPEGAGTFSVGPGLAVAEPVAARVRFEPAAGGAPARELVWEGAGQPPRRARRLAEHREHAVEFASGDTRLAGTLFVPEGTGPHPALVLLHGSGAQDRNGTLPFARFLLRHGVALLGYDKRGVGGSSGDWQKASFEALAADALAAVGFLEARPEIDAARIGLLGASQGGWIGPLAAARSSDVALVVSVASPGVTPGEQTLDLLAGELRIAGVPEDEVQEALALTRRSLEYARSGAGWEEYLEARAKSGQRDWFPYLPLPAEKGDPLWASHRLVMDYDPAPALSALRCPVLALFGGRDLGVPADKNRRAWESALARGGHRDHALVVLADANHVMVAAKTGSLFAEFPGLDGFVREYRTTLLDWLRPRLRLP